MSRDYQKPYNCSVEAALAVIGGRWKAVIIFQLINSKILRFGELLKRIPQISQRMLTNQLRELEEDKIIQREVFAQIPPKVEYQLTEYGKTLTPIMIALREWGALHLQSE